MKQYGLNVLKLVTCLLDVDNYDALKYKVEENPMNSTQNLLELGSSKAILCRVLYML